MDNALVLAIRSANLSREGEAALIEAIEDYGERQYDKGWDGALAAAEQAN